ncbi:MAG: DUF2092 domain-containing protein [Pirellulales bacterium]|nr:DUF2092 domain-containing protein [Pirellulales bacterium]
MKLANHRKHRRQAAFGAAAGLLFVVIAAMAVAASGCNGAGANTSSQATAEETKTMDANQKPDATKGEASEARTAQQVLKDMEAAYAKANSYADEAKVFRYFTRNGDSLEQLFHLELAFERPNRLRMECYDARVVSDGKDFFATVPHVPKVVMKVPAPAKLTPTDVVRDPQLQRALEATPAGPPITILLLMMENPLEQMFRDAMAPPKLLAQETTDGRLCHRVELDSTFGKFVFWVDTKTNVLARLDMPPLLSKQWEQPGEKTTGLTVNFVKAQFDPKFDEQAFKFEVPAEATVAGSLIPISKATPPAPRSEPEKLKLTKLWSADDVKNPGNILVLKRPEGTPRLLVIDGARSVVEIDSDGKTVARHGFDLPPAALVTYLRNAVDKDGKQVFAGSAYGQPQLHVFDENWKRRMSFPKSEDAPNAQLTNIVLSDLAGDGSPELCVGYLGDIGIQGVALDGQRLWRDVSMKAPYPATVTEPDASGKRRLLCTHQDGTLAVFDDQKPVGEVLVPNRMIVNILGADVDGSGKNKYCTLGYSQEHNNLAMGIALEGQELWIYDLPDGDPGSSVEMLSAADIAGDTTKEWLIVAPDSSIHMLNADGTPLDKFNCGAMVYGLAGATLGDKKVLLIARALEKPEGDAHSVLEAWQLEVK